MATLTITTTSAQNARILKAFGRQINAQDVSDPENPVPRDATGAEVKQQVIQYIKRITQAQEMKVKRDALTVSDLNPS